MSALNMLMSAAGAGGADYKLYVDDVFSTYLYTGNDGTQTIVNGIDLAKYGGLVWTKPRTTDNTYGGSHILRDTVRGLGSSAGQGDLKIATSASSGSAFGYDSYRGGFNSFLSNGFSLKSIESEVSFGSSNTNGVSYASWTFRNAPKFFKCATVVKSAGSNSTVDLSSLGTVGMVTVKRTDAAGDWYTWHRSLPAGKLVYINQFAAAATLGHITVSGTTLTLVNGLIEDGSYVVYAWAHDTSADGVIQCGSFTTDAGGNATVNLGWEPQWVLLKKTNDTDDWDLIDTMRGWSNSGSVSLRPNALNAETTFTEGSLLVPTATGFVSASGLSTSSTYIYLAIRRPNKPPKTGAEVYNANVYTGNGVARRSFTGAGFAPDVALVTSRSLAAGKIFVDKLRGPYNGLFTSASTAESNDTNTLLNSFDMNGVTLNDTNGTTFNTSGSLGVDWFFRRAPGVMDVVCATGTGAAHAIAHNLTKAPELVIRKSRSALTQWEVWHSALAATEKLVLNSNAAKAADATAWNSTAPGASSFTVGTGANVNANGATFVTYLFATLAGISKVGSYTGNDSSQNIDCGFSSGARFVLVKRTDAAGEWLVFDHSRGILAANDPHLSLNTTAAEVTTDDSVDPYASGFAVNQNTATNINVDGASYIFLSIA